MLGYEIFIRIAAAIYAHGPGSITLHASPALNEAKDIGKCVHDGLGKVDKDGWIPYKSFAWPCTCHCRTQLSGVRTLQLAGQDSKINDESI